LLVKAGANMNARSELGETALFLAAKHHRFQTLLKLVEFKADVNIPHFDGHTAVT
jgi:ankyrin repeat protein